MSESGKKKKENDKNQNKTIIIIVAISAVIIIALVGVIAFLAGKKQGGDKDDSKSQRAVAGGQVRMVVDEESASNVMDEMRQEVQEGMFECQMSMSWSFENGQAESKDAYVANSTNNTHPIYFDVYLKDTEELIYSSPILPVGTSLTDIKLDKELPAGDYKATVMYTLLKDMDSQEAMSSAGFVISLKVLN
jgi:nitrogen fixation-related uncharacterized protein